LLQPKLAEWITNAKDAGCETGILTNGLLLNQKKAKELIDAGLDWICVSMDGATADIYESVRIGSNFNKVYGSLKHISEIRKGKTPKLMINFVLMPINFHQVEDMIRLAADVGVDQVNLKQCDVIRGDHGKGLGLFAKQETKDIRRLQKNLSKAQRLAKKLNIETTAFPFTPEELPVCDQDPTNSMFIRFNGTAAPCINLAIGGPSTFLGNDVIMPHVHYGSLPESNLEELWETESCKFYRQRFEERVKAQEDAIVNSLMGGSSNRYRTLQDAIDAMPEAPEGCKVCHYLYNI
jgi:MoaA/NifB/PqqE/SkfB family radical SAM enzyme